jgi:hypothetical protein
MSEVPSITQMFWQPRMVRLTQIPMPPLDDGLPTCCYVNPAEIVLIYRARVKEANRDDVPQIDATVVVTKYGHLSVTELPTTVALYRDAAMGHSSKMESVSK